MKCPVCEGSGSQTVDCPYCRDSDPFEHPNVTPGNCKCCNDKGYFTDICSFCYGTGVVNESTSSKRVSA